MINIFNSVKNDFTTLSEGINVVIEISKDSYPVKYEICEESGLLVVDRFLPVNMRYPCNYGYIPKTKGGDGDCLDVLVISRYPISPKAVVKVKILGVLVMKDEKGMDEKILTVPCATVDAFYKDFIDIESVSKSELHVIEHFFLHYKDLDDEKFVKIIGWKDVKHAFSLIK
ncbi:inorganic pyrophosphatase [Anaplasmataceae bacterium AB001_6]|nr:inorganic pyrophosphatase [Anaplasmataceae bacterium AB001_6]